MAAAVLNWLEKKMPQVKQNFFDQKKHKEQNFNQLYRENLN